LLLDEVLDYGDDFAVARVSIHAAARFFDSATQAVPAWVGIEYMAQTMALWAGDQQLRAGKPVQVAFLLGTRQYRSNVARFPRGSVLTVRSDTLYNDQNNVGAFACSIVGDGIAVQARINAFRPSNPQDFVKSKL
jgi:predicted hotdog family 3-hydroxylacyl-ACP dehydratase